jgi:hypothetical protein
MVVLAQTMALSADSSIFVELNPCASHALPPLHQLLVSSIHL